MRSAARPGRLTYSPLLFGVVSVTVYVAARALTCASLKSGPSGALERAERYAQRVTNGAHLMIDLEPSLQLGRIERSEETREGPTLSRRRRLLFAGLGRRRRRSLLVCGSRRGRRRRLSGWQLLARGMDETNAASERQSSERRRGEGDFLETRHVDLSLGSPAHQTAVFSAGPTLVLAGRLFVLASTASAIEAGSGLVVSRRPSSGSTIKKKAK